MNIALYHGYELKGSGSNEYNRYLAKTLVNQGHNVHIICRESDPGSIGFIDQHWRWDHDTNFNIKTLYEGCETRCYLHEIPTAGIYPVYLTDKQRPGHVKSFVELSDDELQAFIAINEAMLEAILHECDIDIVLANHLVMQPYMALAPCQQADVPLAIFLHGSAIEYTVRKDQRYVKLAREAIIGCDAIISGNLEVKGRILELYPDLNELINSKTSIVGIGVDTRLFTPIERAQRPAAIKSFLEHDWATRRNGKPPELLHQLHKEIDALDIQAVTRYRDSYTENQMDSDVMEKVRNIPWQAPIVLFVGALTAGKGLQALISAFPRVLAEHPQAQLVIVGSGAYRETLEALVYALATRNTEALKQLAQAGFDLDRSLESGPWHDVQAYINNENDFLSHAEHALESMAHCVHFLGRMNHAELKYIFPCADVAVFPSIVPEAYGLVLVEALANGVFPLVSYFSGFKDGVDELAQLLPGQLVDHFKIDMDNQTRVKSIADNVCRLIALGAQQDYSTQLAQVARDHYDWKHKARQMAELFATLKR